MIKQTIIILIFLCLFVNLVSANHQLPTDLVNENTSLMEGLGQWSYNVTNGIFWAGLLLGFCFVLWVASASRYDVGRAFGYAGTAAIFGSITLLIIGWITWWIASIFIITGAISIALMYNNK